MNLKKQISLLFILLIACVLYLPSCKKQEVNLEFNADFILKDGDFQAQINSQNKLEEYILKNAPDENITIQEASFGQEEDKIGLFYAIRAKYLLKDGRPVSMIIPLKELSKKSTTSTSVIEYMADCKMTCVPKGNCSGCDQTVTEACRGQICNCNALSDPPGPNSSCDSNMQF